MTTASLSDSIKWFLDHAVDGDKGKTLNVLGVPEGRLAELMQSKVEGQPATLTIVVTAGLIPNVVECCSWSE